MVGAGEDESPWREDLLRLLRDTWAPHEVFSLGEVYQFHDLLAATHPENSHIDEKIRQVLQSLRDDGELTFEEDRGRYSLRKPFPLQGNPVLRATGDALRAHLLAIRDMDGEVVTSAQLQDSVLGFGSQCGIYKPAGSSHALWARQTLKGVYPDKEPTYHPDRSWTYRYAPERGDDVSDFHLDTA